MKAARLYYQMGTECLLSTVANLSNLAAETFKMARTGQNKDHLVEPFRRRKRTPRKFLITESQSSEC